MKVLVNGVGNIGTTLAVLLFQYKTILNIDEVYVYKNTVQDWKKSDLAFLENIGIKIYYAKDISLENVLNEIDYVFDTTANGYGLKNKLIYQKANRVIGFCSQGSEKNFGVPFMSGLNDEKIALERFVQIVSCNTHGAASLISTLAEKDLSNLKHADFVVVRRSEDVGNHERLVGANVVARHLSEDLGTHHAIDVHDMYLTLGIKCPISSSDITTPSQLMHATRFDIEFNTEIDKTSILEKINNNAFIANTSKFDSNLIFELGRRYGKLGRIFNHCILISNNLLFTSHGVKGWAFVPQEGNSIISTIHAYLLQTMGVEMSRQKIGIIKDELLFKEI